jgi:Hypothetical protein (DUF2513)
MIRDMDYIRELLLKIESGQKIFDILSREEAANKGFKDDRGLQNDESEKLSGHIKLLEQVGFINIGYRTLAGKVQIKEITWPGYDFLDSVRDPEIWKKTKDGALQVGGLTFELIKDLAKGFMKKQVEDKTGIKI